MIIPKKKNTRKRQVDIINLKKRHDFEVVVCKNGKTVFFHVKTQVVST